MRLVIMLIISLMMMSLISCKTYQTTNASACLIPFDYKDVGANIQNKRALLIHYCICKDESVCN